MSGFIRRTIRPAVSTPTCSILRTPSEKTIYATHSGYARCNKHVHEN
jgi:hypothetical protein